MGVFRKVYSDEPWGVGRLRPQNKYHSRYGMGLCELSSTSKGVFPVQRNVFRSMLDLSYTQSCEEHFKTEKNLKSPNYLDVKMFNNLPKPIKDCDNVNNFKRMLNGYLSDKVLYDRKQDWLLALKVHGLRFSDTETDSDDFEEFDHIHEQYKPPPLPLDVIQRNLVVVAPRRPENVWTKRLEAQLEKAKHSSVVEDPIITPVFSPSPIHIPVIDNSLPKKKKKRKRKNKKKQKNNESISYQEQNLINSDHELENVHFENAFPEMHSKEASVIFPFTNCEVSEVEIDKSKNEAEFVPLDLKNVIEENHGSIKINEINKENEQDQSIGNDIDSYPDPNHVIEVNTENNVGNQKKKKIKFIPLHLPDFQEFDHIRGQYKSPPLPLDVVAPRRPENVWINRLEARLEKDKHFSVLEDPLFPADFNHSSIHIPVVDSSLEVSGKKVDNHELEVAESRSSNVSTLKQIVDFQSFESLSEIDKNSTKKKKKKKGKKKKKENTIESLSHQGQNLRNSDYKLENVHFENTFPEMHSIGASTTFSSTNCEVSEVEIDKSKKESHFISVINLIEKYHRSIKIKEINKGNEQDQSISYQIDSCSNQNHVIEVDTENNVGNQKKKKSKFIAFRLSDEKFPSPAVSQFNCLDIETPKNQNEKNNTNKQSNSNERQNLPIKGKKKKNKVNESSNILCETFSNFTSKVVVPRNEQKPSNNNKVRDARNEEMKTSERQIVFRNANESIIGTPDSSLINNLNLWSLSELSGDETKSRLISFPIPDRYQTVIKVDNESNDGETKTDYNNDLCGIVSDVKKKNTPEKIETNHDQIDHELPTHLLNSDTLDGIYKENLEYESKETKEIALSTSTIILSDKKKKKNRKRTKHMQENTVSGCTGFNTFSNNIKVYEDKKQENAYEENFECFDKSDTIKDNILGINCGFSGGANSEKTSRRHKNKVKHHGTDVLNNIEINGDMSIVPYNDGLACGTLENLLINSDSHYLKNNYFSEYEYGNAKNILTEFNSFEGVGNGFSSYTSEQEQLHDVRRQRSILFQTYEYNTDQHSNKMVTFKLTEDPKENVCWTKTTRFLYDESEENLEGQSETLVKKNETRSLQYPIDHNETNSVRFRENDTQIVLKTRQNWGRI